ncbi:MAG: nucleoside 2-deoxyribosyltransferase [Arcobacter sp.]|uniref:nucleoside 2-deoxyribosyltransferase n=1 Tax=Arcobacter sp. TaxID=1872629 RepID=UPI003CFBFF65
MKKIYIAGFDVFESNSIEIGKKYVQLCKNYGFEGLYPLDNIVDFNQEKRKIAQDIFKANINLINQCDIVIANLNSFRGKEADSGTVWECGYATALGKKVYGYMKKEQNYIDSFSKDEKNVIDDVTYDLENRVIEDFDYPINLMIACSVEKIIFGEFEDYLKEICK